MNENVLVTGAYGLLGSHTVRELIEKGYHVRAFGRDADKLSKLAEEYDDGQIENNGTDIKDAVHKSVEAFKEGQL